MNKALKEKYGSQAPSIAKKLKGDEAEQYNKLGELMLCKKDDVDKVLKDDKFMYKEYEDMRSREIHEYLNPPEVKEGVYVCRNKDCRSKKTYYYQLQTRSADEPMTTFITCAKCKTKWRE
jgi:DNA-directed RNA polymerase subunit M/transcription elongation factor TFIIS